MSVHPAPPADAVVARAYHHGHLAEALRDAGVELARVGGPDAVVLREAARQVGVSATAAYRHFDSQTALVEAVKQRALEYLAEHMQAAARAAGARPDGAGSSADALPGAAAVARLEAIGRAYLEFALTEPGLFRTFCIGLPLMGDVDLDSDVPAFGVLTGVLEELAADGLLDPATAQWAPISAWASVHGLAILCLDGPLSVMPPDELEAIFQGTLRMVLSGLLVRP